MSGKTKEYLFSPSESAGDIAQFVFDNWPAEWEDEAVRNDFVIDVCHKCSLSLSLSLNTLQF